MALGADEHDHSFAFEVWHIIGFAILSEVGSETGEKEFTLLLEDDGTSAEEDIGFDLVTLFQELDSVFELEVVIVVIGLGTETDFLHFLLFLVSFRLFLLFLLRVEEFLVVHNAADRRVSRCCNLNQIEVLLIGNFHCLLEGVDPRFNIVAYEAHLTDTADLIIDTMRVLFDNTTATRSGSNSSYCFNYLGLINCFSCGDKIPYHRKSVQNYNNFLTYARKMNFFSLFS